MSQKEEKERDRGRRTEEGKLLFCLKLVELDMRNEWRMKKKKKSLVLHSENRRTWFWTAHTFKPFRQSFDWAFDFKYWHSL